MAGVLTPLGELQERLVAGRVVVMVGAGVSMQSCDDELVSWPGLVRNGIGFCRAWTDADERWCAATTAHLDEARVLEAAGAVANRLREKGEPEGLLAKWLGSTVARIRAPRFDPADHRAQPGSLIHAIWQLGAPILTTNYDTLIEDVTGAGSTTWKNPAGLQLALDGSEPRLIGHVHGVWGQAESVILSEGDYGELRGDRAVATALQGAAYTMTLLFIGCGGTMDDPTFDHLRRWLIKDLGWSARTHFLLEQSGEPTRTRQAAVGADHIRVIGYGNSHSELERFIRRELLDAPASIAHTSPNNAGRRGSHRVPASDRDLLPTYGMLGPDDAAELFAIEADRIELQLGRVHGLLRQLEDRLRGCPEGWPAGERTDHHRFYARAAGVTTDWLVTEARLLAQLGNSLTEPLAGIAAASGGFGPPELDAATTATVSRLATLAVMVITTSDVVGDRLTQRLRESEHWRSVSAVLAPVLTLLTGDLDRVVQRLRDIAMMAGGPSSTD